MLQYAPLANLQPNSSHHGPDDFAPGIEQHQVCISSGREHSFILALHRAPGVKTREASPTHDSSLRRSHVSVGMAKADADSVLGGLFNDLESAFQFWSNCHDLDVATTALPKTLEELT